MNNKNKLSFNNIFFLYIKMANDYFQKHKEKLQKEARAIYQNCSEKKKKMGKRSEKNIKIILKKKTQNKVNIISEKQKQKQVEYVRIYYLAYKK